jgi:hypothetical protein
MSNVLKPISNGVSVMSKNEMAVVFKGEQLPDLAPSLEIFSDVIKNSTFLPRVQLYSKGGAIDRGLIAPGHYGSPVSDELINDLGNEIDVIPFAWRAKAIDTTDRDNVIVSYDPKSPEYQRIKEASEADGATGYMYGVTFLVYERGTGQFYELFFGTTSARREAGNFVSFCAISASDAELLSKKTGKDVKPRGPLACTLLSKYITKGTFTWFAPVCTPCSTPFTNLPDYEVVLGEIKKFYAQKNSEVEKVEAPTKKRAR